MSNDKGSGTVQIDALKTTIKEQENLNSDAALPSSESGPPAPLTASDDEKATPLMEEKERAPRKLKSKPLKTYFDENTNSIVAFTALLGGAAASLTLATKWLGGTLAIIAFTLAMIVGRELWENLSPYESKFDGPKWFVITIVVGVLALLAFSLIKADDVGVVSTLAATASLIFSGIIVRLFKLDKRLISKQNKKGWRRYLKRFFAALVLLFAGAAFFSAPYLMNFFAAYGLVLARVVVALLAFYFCGLLVWIALEIILAPLSFIKWDDD